MGIVMDGNLVKNNIEEFGSYDDDESEDEELSEHEKKLLEISRTKTTAKKKTRIGFKTLETEAFYNHSRNRI